MIFNFKSMKIFKIYFESDLFLIRSAILSQWKYSGGFRIKNFRIKTKIGKIFIIFQKVFVIQIESTAKWFCEQINRMMYSNRNIYCY